MRPVRGHVDLRDWNRGVRPGQRCTTRFCELHVRRVGRFAPALGLRVREGGECGSRDVPQDTDRVRGLVIAHQHDGAPATGGRLRLQGHQEVQQRPHLGTAVHVVAGLHERDVAPGPATLARLSVRTCVRSPRNASKSPWISPMAPRAIRLRCGPAGGRRSAAAPPPQWLWRQSGSRTRSDAFDDDWTRGRCSSDVVPEQAYFTIGRGPPGAAAARPIPWRVPVRSSSDRINARTLPDHRAARRRRHGRSLSRRRHAPGP